MFKETRKTNWYVIIIFLLMTPVLTAFQQFVFTKEKFFLDIYRSIAFASGGLMQPTLVFYLILFLIIVIILFMLFGRLRFKDLYLRYDKLKQGLLFIFITWCVINILGIIAALITSGSLEWNLIWDKHGIAVVLGIFLAQLLGNAFYEEIVFRGFLFPQLYLKFGGDREKVNKRILIYAIIGSQLYFSLIHLPHRIVGKVSGAMLVLDLFGLFITGVLLVLLFLRTKNLFIIIGIHALLNKPTSLVETPFNDQFIAAFLLFILLIFWKKIAGIIKTQN